jgi:hypothetical protein
MGTSQQPKNSLSLQERDVALLKSLFESRVMTTAHVANLFFDGKKEGAKKRLQKLKAEKLISERPRRAFEPSLLFLAPKGLEVLKEHGVLREFPSLPQETLLRRTVVSPITLAHELEVMDLKAAFHSAIRGTKTFSVVEFTTWPLLNQFTARRPGREGEEVLVKPDGFVRIHETEADDGLSEHTFFFELDRSTETLDTLVSRALCYLDYYKSGNFAVKNGGEPTAFREYPFRVLMVFKTAERRNNIAEQLVRNNPPVLTRAWLSTQDEATKNPLGAIWVTPADYRTTVKGTAFDSEARAPQSGYQRQTARDVWIEKKVPKRSLLSD